MSDTHDPKQEPAEAQAPAAYTPPHHSAIMAADPSWFIPPPFGWRHPVTGRGGWQPDPALLAFGQYLKRARYLAGISQERLEELSSVDQSVISRTERAMAPATKIEKVVKLSDALGRNFPLGYCPHEHSCLWQPAPPPPAERPLDWFPDFLRGTTWDPAYQPDEEAP